MASRAALRLLKLARDNDSTAQCQLGVLYLFGDAGHSPNADAALMWLTRAASQGVLEASRLIARHFSPDTVPDAFALLGQYEIIASEGDAVAALHAGLVWSRRDGNEAAARARYFLGCAADRGSSEAQLMLARLIDHESGHANPNAIELLARAAEGGSDQALKVLAERAWQSQNIEGLPALRKIARKDDGISTYRLGMMLRLAAKQLSDDALLAESTEWLSYACEAGHPEGRYEFGRMLAGLAPGTARRNYKRATRLLEIALSEGVSEAGVAIAALHDMPRFPGRDPLLALEALTRSARLGSAEAQYRLGALLAKRLRRTESDGVEPRLEAVRWLHEAGTAGHPAAQSLLDKLADRPPHHSSETQRYQNEMIDTISASHPAIGARLRLAAEFGLSRREMLSFDPLNSDCGICLLLTPDHDEPKSRTRLVQITASQRACLDQARAALDAHSHDDLIGPYPVRYRKFMSIAKQRALDWNRFRGERDGDA